MKLSPSNDVFFHGQSPPALNATNIMRTGNTKIANRQAGIMKMAIRQERKAS